MASLTTDAQGRRLLRFADLQGDRRTLRLGRMPKRDAEEVQRNVEALLYSKVAGTTPEPHLARWQERIPDRLAEKLAALGVIDPRSKERAGAASNSRLGAFVAAYVEMRQDVKPNTRKVWRQTQALLSQHFGDSREFATINALDARAFHVWLVAAESEDGARRRFSSSSVIKHVTIARQFFEAAKHGRVIAQNPFVGIKLGKKTNRSRQRFVDRDLFERVLDGCRDPEFRLVLALSRFGGLRIPSELDGLLWQHIDRERGRILVTSPKTEHHEGGASREIPLFPELVPFIDEWFAVCPEGREYVMLSNRLTEAAWRTRLGKLLHRLGIPAWPKKFHNMRASRQTELESQFPSHVVCRWMGNSEQVARDHYLQTTDDHFAAALIPDDMARAPKMIRHRGARERREAHDNSADDEKSPISSTMRTDALPCASADGSGWEEQLYAESSNEIDLDLSRAPQMIHSPDLARLAEVWDSLPPLIRREILRLAELQ